MISRQEWLRGRSDQQLTLLLTARPDTLLPTPGSLTVLARRLDSPASAHRALARLDRFGVQVIQAVWLLGDTADESEDTDSASASGSAPVRAAAIAARLGGPATDAQVREKASYLAAIALLETVGDGWRLSPPTREALGRFPAGLGPVGNLSPAAVAKALLQAGPGRALLEKLSPGPPIGTIEARSPRRATADKLIATGLLRARDERSVILPREVALALRGRHPFGPAHPTPPDLETTARTDIDGAAATQALAAHRRARRILEIFSEQPLPALKSGALGVVALRQLATALDLPESTVALYSEVLAAGGLIASDLSPYAATTRKAHWMLTEAADSFLGGDEAAGWALLADTWLMMARAPGQVGTKDAKSAVRNALSDDVSWPAGPTERHRLLEVLASAPTGHAVAVDSVVDQLTFLAPLRRPDSLRTQVSQLLAEATELAIVAFDGLGTAGRALVADSVTAAAAAMDATLPDPIDTLLIQADMTVVAPGRLARALAAQLALLAEVESVGSASVYRVTEASVRRGLDAGMAAAEIAEFFRAHSATGIPQALNFIIDDVSRRYGRVRAGSAGCFVRSEDPTLLSAAVAAATHAGLPLRTIAPTVAVSSLELDIVTETLREAGVALLAEDAAGTVVDVRPAPRRIRATPPPRGTVAEHTAPSAHHIAAAIARMRAGEVAADSAQQPAEIAHILAAAARARTSVWIGYADAQGSTARRLVDPLVVSGGTMVAFDQVRSAPHTFSLHRVSSAHLAEEDQPAP